MSALGRRGTTVVAGAVGGPATEPPGRDAASTIAFRPGHPFIDSSNPAFWRYVLVGGALAYVAGFHLSLGRLRIRAGR